MSTSKDSEADGAVAAPAVNTAVSADEKNSTPTTAPVKEGGIRGWLQVIGAFLIFFNVWYEKT